MDLKVLGISLRKGELYYTVIEGENQRQAAIVELKRMKVRDYEASELMVWFESSFRELITEFAPDKVAYKLQLDTNKEQMTYLQFPLGVLNLICGQLHIPINSRSTSYITRERKAMAKKYFGQARPDLRDSELDVIVTAWHELVY